MRLNYTKVIGAGIAGTLVMTGVGLFVAPMMGLMKMNPADMLAMQMGHGAIFGWMAHLMIGVVLATLFASVANTRLPGPAPIRGALFAVAPWLMAQVAVMPMMGMGFFSGSVPVAMGSLVGHLMYGAVIGMVIGSAQP